MPRVKKYSKPRGRMSAYSFFVQTCRQEHKKKYPDESTVFSLFSKKCAERWKTMLEMEKKRFQDMADGDKKRYELETQHCVPVPAKGRGGGRKTKRRQTKNPNAPKRSLSAYFWFCSDERVKVKGMNPEYGVGKIARELGRLWSEADPEVRMKYEIMAKLDKARYDKAVNAYKTMKGKVAVEVPLLVELPDSDAETEVSDE